MSLALCVRKNNNCTDLEDFVWNAFSFRMFLDQILRFTRPEIVLIDVADSQMVNRHLGWSHNSFLLFLGPTISHIADISNVRCAIPRVTCVMSRASFGIILCKKSKPLRYFDIVFPRAMHSSLCYCLAIIMSLLTCIISCYIKNSRVFFYSVDVRLRTSLVSTINSRYIDGILWYVNVYDSVCG